MSNPKMSPKTCHLKGYLLWKNGRCSFFWPGKKNNQHNTDVRCCAVKTNTTPEFTFVDVGCKQSSKKSGKSGGDDTKT